MSETKIALEVTVMDVPFRYFCDAPSILRYASKPLKLTDDPALVAMTGDQLKGSFEAQRFLEIRETAAKDLGEHFARLFLEHMEAQDTLNGYPIEKAES